MGITILPGPALRERTTLQLGGTCRAELVLACEADAEALPATLRETGGMPLVLGFGSNILACDGELDLTIVTPPIGTGPEAVRQDVTCNCDEAVFVRCGAGVRLPRLLAWLGERGLSGLEGLAGIPGSVGGAVAMNAGSYGVEIGARVNRVRVFTETHGLVWMGPTDVTLGYRHFSVKGLARDALCVVLEVELAMTPAPAMDIKAAMAAHMAQKRATQPITEASAGCVFKNPAPGVSAGKLLDDAGFKGFALGGMAFSTMHANFMINTGGGTAAQALELLDLARERVRERFGHTLQTEVRVCPCL
ncbi:MAG: UDP-N-acetylmuramate dehydrogenase [Desulfovibrionaceae bacterium]